MDVATAPGAADHPILRGVEVEKLKGFGSLYKVSPLADSAAPLLLGSLPDKPTEPVAWVNQSRYGGRVFYTALADPKDFDQPAQNRLLANAIHWAAGLPVAPPAQSDAPGKTP